MAKLIFAFRNFENTLNNLSRKVSFEINEEMSDKSGIKYRICSPV